MLHSAKDWTIKPQSNAEEDAPGSLTTQPKYTDMCEKVVSHTKAVFNISL